VPENQLNMGKGDPKKPRGKMSSYALFVKTCWEEHKKKHPDASVNFSEFSKKCSERWKTMSAKEKGKFEDMAKADKARYEREMKTYIPCPQTGDQNEVLGPQCTQCLLRPSCSVLSTSPKSKVSTQLIHW
jgi:high mobility group protein B1